MRFLVLTFSLILTIISPTKGWSYTLTQPNIKGFDLTAISIHLVPTNCPADFPAYLEDAIDFWNDAPRSRLILQRGIDVNIAMTDIINLNFNVPIIATCSVDMETDLPGTNNDTTLGVGFSADTDMDGALDKGRLIINMTPTSANRFDLLTDAIKKGVIRHEIGHVLGLGHSSEEAALMYFSASQKEDALLHQDDIDGISHLYPQDEFSGDYFFGCARLATIKPPSPPRYLGFLSLIALILPLTFGNLG